MPPGIERRPNHRPRAYEHVATTLGRSRLPVGAGKTRQTLTLPEELVAELDAWRAEQRPIPTLSVAVAELLRQALEQWRKEQGRKT